MNITERTVTFKGGPLDGQITNEGRIGIPQGAQFINMAIDMDEMPDGSFKLRTFPYTLPDENGVSIPVES